MCLGCSSSFSATEDDSAGDSGTSAGGNPPGGAGHAGGTSGDTHAAGDFVQCFVANTCLDQCGGSVVYTGCCECEPPSVNQLTCTGTH